MSEQKLFLLDGSYLAYRSYFAFIRNPLISSRGEHTSAVFGFTSSLIKLIKEEQPDYMAVIFDSSEPTFRHKVYKEYKATRDKAPEDMIEQIPRIKEIIEAFQIPMIEMPGYEADDVMATLAKQASQKGLTIYLFTSDKDLMQLVNDDILIYKPGKSGEDMEVIDKQWIRKNWQVEPEQVRDVLGLAGDSSDNIPGVPKVGIKTAIKLIEQFGSMENLLSKSDQIKSKSIQEKIQQNVEQAKLSYQLVTIDDNVPIQFDLQGLTRREPNHVVLIQLFKELEFHSLIEEFQPESRKVMQNYKTITNKEQFQAFIKELRSQNFFVFDLETTHTHPLKAKLVGFSFSWKEGEAYYIPVKDATVHKPTGPGSLFQDTEKRDADVGFTLQDVLPPIKAIMEDESKKKCGQNIKYDMLVLQRYNVTVKGLSFDTMIASYLLNPSGRQHNLDSLCVEYLNYIKVPTSDLIGKGKKQITMREVPLEKISFYANEDADFTFRLKQIFEPKLKSAKLYDLFEQVEIPLIHVLKQMEWNGVSLDTQLLKNLSKELQGKLDQLEEKIFEDSGEKFNINSPQQLATVLFEKLCLPTSRRTKTGYSTDVNVLEELANIHPVPQYLLDYRQLSKLKSTYIDALPKLINPRTGRLHTSYNQTIAATGRLSSSDPNLQNIPIRTELGRKIRKAFVPGDKDHYILDADYSQVELRIMAHLSDDANLLGTFKKDLDVHAATGAQIFGIPLDQVTEDHRRKAKEINFGIMYGMGRFGLSSRLDISVEDAEAFIHHYFQQYPGVRQFIDRTIADAREKGYVTTMMGRRRYLPEIQSQNSRMRDFAERTAINTPIQGTAADMIKVAMIRIHEAMQKQGLKSMMIMQVHDELVFEVAESELDTMKQLVKTSMESALELKVPVKVDVGVGKNWLDAH